MAYNTTVSLDKLTCTDYVDFGKHQDRFGQFSWSKTDSNYLDIKLNVFKREDKMQNFDWDRTFQSEKLISISLCDKEMNSLWQQTTFSENKMCRQFFNPHYPKTWRSNWNFFTRWLRLWIAPTEGFVWRCCDTMQTTHKPLMLKFVYSDGRRRKENFSKLCMSAIELTKLYIFLTSWI